MIYFHITLHPTVHIHDFIFRNFTQLSILLINGFIFLRGFCVIPDLKELTLYKLLLGYEQQQKNRYDYIPA